MLWVGYHKPKVMQILQDVSLQPHNTFGIDARARYWVTITSVVALQELLRNPAYQSLPKLILGGGSNVLFTQDFEGIVIKMDIRGIEVIEENEDYGWIRAGAGVNWHALVLHCIEQGYGGIENMSLIPGTVGAAPMQNIGAYGVEMKDVFVSLEAVEIATGKVVTFDHAQCQFGYRNSVFKNDLKGKYIITSVTMRLHKNPVVNTAYGDIEKTLARLLADRPGEPPNIRDVSRAVIQIRQSKLPDPAQIGNAGSFFKNPVIPRPQYDTLVAQYENMPGYPVSDQEVKVPAGWLIEQCGWKGKRIADIGVHDKQALVLVNHGGGKGNDLKDLAYQIQDSVKQKFNIVIEPEVNVL